jgi:alpha-tubulin suppressor-like RCC1 family protein
VVKVVGGSDHALALLSDGRVVAWGFNSYGQLGDNTTVSKSYPVYVQNLSPPVQDVAAGGDFSLALKNGFVYAWGSNGSGQLGDGSPTTASRPYPNPVKAPGGSSYLSQVVGIAAGKLHGLAVLSTGEVVAWGGNASGQLGDGTTQNRTVPVFVLEPGGSQILSGIARVAGGVANSYAVTRDGEVLAWGDDQYGACGDGVAGSPGVQVVPTWVRGTGGVSRLSGVTAVSAGYGSACAVLSGGTFVCWGNGAGGALGNDTWDISPVPVQGAELGSPCGYLVGVQQVAAGLEHSLALLSGGRVAAWGRNDCGQLGAGDGAAYWSQAVLVKGAGGTGQLQGAVQVAAGGKHSLAVLSDGRVLAWGSNSRGKLGDGTTSDRPVPVYVKDPSGSAELRGVVQVAAGRDAVLGHSLALLSDGRVLAWGANDYGQLGNGISGSGRYSALPVKVLGVGGTGELTGVVQVAAGYDHCLALLSDGSVVAWGNNDRGQLGNGTSGSGTGKAYPVRVRGVGGSGYLTGVVEIAAGYKCSLARLSDGRVVAWGYSYVLGDGNTADRSVPGYVKGVGGSGSLTGVVALAVHSSHAVAVLSDGRAVAWGVNTGGPLGDGTETTRLYPVLVKDASGATLAGVSGCAAGGSHTLLVMSDGHSMGCGKNSYGQVGTWVDSYNPNVLNPVLVRKKWPGW